MALFGLLRLAGARRIREGRSWWLLLLVCFLPFLAMKAIPDSALAARHGIPFGLGILTLVAGSLLFDLRSGAVAAVPGFRDYLLYLFYFPKYFSGPLERYGDFAPQLDAPAKAGRRAGLYLIATGCFRKWALARYSVAATGFFFANREIGSGWVTLLAAYLYALELYCNFSGYTDIARGVSRLCGIELSRNFSFPFLAKSPQEFWQRWNMSFSFWLRDYVMGGVFSRTKSAVLAIFVTFFAMGFWNGNGAEWKYLTLGCYCGAVMVIYYLVKPALTAFRARLTGASAALYRLACWVLTLQLVISILLWHHAPDLAFLRDSLASLRSWSWDTRGRELATAFLLLVFPLVVLDALSWRRHGNEQELTALEMTAGVLVAAIFWLALISQYGGFTWLDSKNFFFRAL